MKKNTMSNLNTIRSCAISLCATALLTLPALAQVGADAVFSGFEPNGDFVFELGGQDLKNAEIYFSERGVAYLILAPELSSPILINPRTRSVESVHLMKVAKRQDGSIDLLADATLARLDQFSLDGKEVHFNLNGQAAKLKPKPWLLGTHSGQEMLDDSPDYARLADAYNPTARSLEALRAQAQEATVRVYFGSWCPACKRLVPRLLRVAREIEGAKINFEFYGLPSPLDDDPESKRMDIRGVPTAIVFRGAKEIGRLTKDQWNTPEASLVDVLKNAS